MEQQKLFSADVEDKTFVYFRLTNSVQLPGYLVLLILSLLYFLL